MQVDEWEEKLGLRQLSWHEDDEDDDDSYDSYDSYDAVVYSAVKLMKSAFSSLILASLL